MKKEGYVNISGKLDSAELKLGWLSGVTLWRTDRAVAMENHRHPRIELLFCLKGNLEYEIEGYGQTTVLEGSGIVIPANTRHMVKDGTDSPCERLGLHIAGTMPSSGAFAVFTPADFKSLHARLVAGAARPFRLDARLHSAIKELGRTICDKDASRGTDGFIRTLCCEILFRTVQALAHPAAPCGPQMMDEAVRFLENRFSEKISLTDLARHMGYGRTQLFHLFKLHTGLTPNEYLVRCRIRNAKEMLADGGSTAEAAARACGFSSTSYFRSVYLRYTGQKPDVPPRKAGNTPGNGNKREKHRIAKEAPR